jgi:hypothetical protein
VLEKPMHPIGHHNRMDSHRDFLEAKLDAYSIRTHCRQSNRAILASSSTLWALVYNNLPALSAPLDVLTNQAGGQSANVKFWDLPLLHILPDPTITGLPRVLQYKTRRSGWLYSASDRAFCLEAVYSKTHEGERILVCVQRLTMQDLF